MKIYWDQVQEDPDGFKFDSIKKALDDAQTESIVVWTDTGKLMSYLRANPNAAANLQVFGKGKTDTLHIMLYKNSPLTPMFRQGSLRLYENGMVDHMLSKWMRVPNFKKRLSLKSRMVVGIGQIVLIFYIMVGTICTVLLILGLEILWHKQDWYQCTLIGRY